MLSEWIKKGTASFCHLWRYLSTAVSLSDADENLLLHERETESFFMGSWRRFKAGGLEGVEMASCCHKKLEINSKP